MGKGTKVKIKVSGSAAGVKKALNQIVSDMPEKVTPLREADFRARQKKTNVSS
jgi:hypothetical protein